MCHKKLIIILNLVSTKHSNLKFLGKIFFFPWHNACFNSISGQQEEPPGLDSLATFATRIVWDKSKKYPPKSIFRRM